MATEVKHTPGPWEVGDLDHAGQRIVRQQHIEICTCWHHSVTSIEREMEANARLIAAAPELLEALNWAMKQIGEPRLIKGQNDHHFNAWHAANAAIAKAEGRSDAVRVEGVA